MLKVNDHVQQIFTDLRRHNLRHPGSVSARVVKLFARDTVTIDHIAAARLEWLKLGLDKSKGASA